MSLDTEVKVLASVVSKIDTSIEKLTELSNSISKLLAVHDERLDQLERLDDQKSDDIKELHSRITTTSREVCDKIDAVEGMIERKLKENRDSSTEQHAKIHDEIKSEMKSVSDRLAVLEQWRWYIIGGCVVIGFLFGNTDLISKLIN